MHSTRARLRLFSLLIVRPSAAAAADAADAAAAKETMTQQKLGRYDEDDPGKVE